MLDHCLAKLGVHQALLEVEARCRLLLDSGWVATSDVELVELVEPAFALPNERSIVHAVELLLPYGSEGLLPEDCAPTTILSCDEGVGHEEVVVVAEELGILEQEGLLQQLAPMLVVVRWPVQ